MALLQSHSPWTEDGKIYFDMNGSFQGSFACRDDHRTGEIIHGKSQLRARAEARFDQWWQQEKTVRMSEGVRQHAEDATEQDLAEMRRIFAIAFIEYYRKERAHYDKNRKYLAPGLTIHIVRTEHTGHSRLYEIELLDDECMEEPVRAEIEVKDNEEAELRELEPHD